MCEIEFKGIQKSFEIQGKELRVLSELNARFPANEISAIVGKSGCGKTTLLRLAARLDTPTAGEIICGDDLRMAFVFQEARLMPWLNARRNVCFGAKRTAEDLRRADRCLKLVGLEDYAEAFPKQLSGGMQQRVAIARALFRNANFFLMDEPFAALDHFTREEMQNLLMELCAENHIGALFVTHSVDEAVRIADSVSVLRGGRIAYRSRCGDVNVKDKILNELDREEES